MAEVADTVNAIFRDGESCIKAVTDEPEYAPLARHLPPFLDFATEEQLSDHSLPTDVENKTISEVFPKFKACLQQRNNRLAEIAPTLASILRTGNAKADDVIELLAAKRVSWGEYIKRIKDIAEVTHRELHKEQHRLAVKASLAARKRMLPPAHAALRTGAAEAYVFRTTCHLPGLNSQRQRRRED
jgi:hypothetical protein